MTVYTTVPADDSNLEIQLTEAPDLVTINIQPASFTGSGGGTGAVDSVNGLIGDVVLTTTQIPEGDNLYYTTSRSNTDFDAQLATKTTTDLAEGDNLYYTDDRVNTFLTDGSVTAINFGNNTTLTWNATDYTLDMPLNGVTVQLGQETLGRAVNKTGGTILNGQVVRVTGAQGQRITVDLANNFSDATSATVFGVATEDILNNQEGFITLTGLVRDIDTSALTEGSPVYLGAVPGSLVDTKPETPAHDVLIGYCIRSHANLGSIYVKVQNGYEISELHDVLITTPTNGDILVYNGASDIWTNQTLDYVTDSELATQVGILNTTIVTGDSNTLASANAYTDSQVSAVVVPVTTDDLPEGSVNKYFSDALAVAALEANSDTVLTGNLTVNGDFVVLNQVKLNNFEFPVFDYGRTDQWPGATQTIDMANAYNKIQLRGATTPTVVFDTSNFFDNVNNLRMVHLLIDYHSGPGDIIWPTDLVWQGGVVPNFAGGIARDRYLLKMIGSGDRGWTAHLEEVFNVNASSSTTNLKFNKLTDLNITDGTAGQVLSTNADGTFTFVDQSGGGGASALGDLTDVTITGVADGDILRYNGTALEWQNTNLGLSLTPTLSADATQYLQGSAQITNWGDYQDPNAYVELYLGITLVVPNSAITVSDTGAIAFNLPPTAQTYTLKVQVQDFGDLASDTAEISITKADTNFQYWRVGEFSGPVSNNFGLYNFRLYDAISQSGTQYPPNMTSDTTPAPYVASSNYSFSATYAAWKAFDTAPGGWNWWLGYTGSFADAWVQIDLGSAQTIKSLVVGPTYTQGITGCKIWASATGAFAGEEVLIATIVGDGVPTSTYTIG